MYNGIGLQTPRGSGTNGYIQNNKFFVKPKTSKVVVDNSGKGFEAGQGTGGITKKPNKDILEHDRKRQIELKLVVLEDKLTDQGYTSAEIVEKLAEARSSLEAAEVAIEAGPIAIVDRKISATQTHQIAARKEKQLETLRAALKIGGEADRQRKEDDQDLNSGEEGEIDEPMDDKSYKKNVKNERNDEIKGEKDWKIVGGRDWIDELKSHKNKEREREQEAGSSDSESDERPVNATGKKHQEDSRGSDSEHDRDIEVRRKRHKTSSTHRKGKRYDSSDSESDDGQNEKICRRHDKKGRRSDDDGSDSVQEKYEKTHKWHQKKGRQHDRDDVYSDEDEYEKIRKRHGKKRRHNSGNSEDDAGRKNEKISDRYYKKSRKHDSDESDSETNERMQRRHKEKTRRHDGDVSDADDQRHEKSLRWNGKKSDDDSDGSGMKYKKTQKEKHLIKTIGKDYSNDGPHLDSRYSSKRNPSERERNKQIEKGVSGHELKNLENSRSPTRKDGQSGDDYSRSIRFEGGQKDDKIELGNRIGKRDELSRLSGKDPDYKGHPCRRYTKDEENRGRKHKREEEEMYGRHGRNDDNYRHGRDDDNHRHGSRRHNKEKEEHERGGDEGSWQGNSSKRIRYEDSRLKGYASDKWAKQRD